MRGLVNGVVTELITHPLFVRFLIRCFSFVGLGGSMCLRVVSWLLVV